MSRRNALASLSLCVGLAAGCADVDQEPIADDFANGDIASEENAAPIAAQQQQQPGNIVKLLNVAAFGTGCLAGTWKADNIVRDNEIVYLRVHFTDYRIDANRNTAPTQSKNCELKFLIDVAPGFKAAVAKALFYVSAELGVGMTSTLETAVGFPGQILAPFPWSAIGPIATGLGNFELPMERKFSTLRDAECGKQTTVSIFTRTTLRNPDRTSGSLNLSDVNGSVALQIALGGERC